MVCSNHIKIFCTAIKFQGFMFYKILRTADIIYYYLLCIGYNLIPDNNIAVCYTFSPLHYRWASLQYNNRFPLGTFLIRF